MAEEIDIFDANLTRIGKMERRKAHYEGQWHRTFHCWVVTSRPERAILFQLRAPRMKNFPNMLDVSAAGHISAGESVSDGIREVREELGLPTDLNDFEFLGERVEVADQANGQKNREYQSVYLWRVEKALSEYSPDCHEVYGLFWLGIDDGYDLFSGKRESVHVIGIEYDKIKGFFETGRDVTVKDFVPRIQRYYLSALMNAERLLEGKTILAIS